MHFLHVRKLRARLLGAVQLYALAKLETKSYLVIRIPFQNLNPVTVAARLKQRAEIGAWNTRERNYPLRLKSSSPLARHHQLYIKPHQASGMHESSAVLLNTVCMPEVCLPCVHGVYLS